MTELPYSINLDTRYAPLELVDVQALPNPVFLVTTRKANGAPRRALKKSLPNQGVGRVAQKSYSS